MLDKKFFAKTREILLSYALKRREVIKLSGDAEQRAKKAIFSFQRDDHKLAKQLLSESLALIKQVEKMSKIDKRLANEGSFKSAQEEYTEAELFGQCLSSGIISNIKGVSIEPDIYIGGLCDVPGELHRYIIKLATDKKFTDIKKYYTLAEEIITELVDMDLTGYNRNKFDQAKSALQRIEQIVYEISLKR